MEWNCFWAEYKDFWPLLCQTLPHRNTPTGNGGYMVRQTWNGKCEFLLHPDTGHPPFYRVPPQTRPDGRPSAASIKTELKAAYPHAFSEEEMERFFHECDSIIPCKGGADGLCFWIKKDNVPRIPSAPLQQRNPYNRGTAPDAPQCWLWAWHGPMRAFNPTNR